MTEGVEPFDAEPGCQVAHGDQRLGGVALPPRVAREHVAGGGLDARLESEAGAADERTVGARLDHVGARRPARPFAVAEVDERARVLDGLVRRPSEILLSLIHISEPTRLLSIS